MASRKRTATGPQDRAIARIERELAGMRQRQAVLVAALGLPEGARRGERGRLGDLNDAVIKIQDYLLRTSERIDTILGTLKNHRELLVKMNQRTYQVGTRERIRMELDIMHNTLSILGLYGVELDEGLLPEIAKLRESAGKTDEDVAALRKLKEKLDKRFDVELRKVDRTSPARPKGKEAASVPGYR